MLVTATGLVCMGMLVVAKVVGATTGKVTKGKVTGGVEKGTCQAGWVTAIFGSGGRVVGALKVEKIGTGEVRIVTRRGL